jgi:hypothetical protein
VTEPITAVVGSRTLAGSGWQLGVERPIERAERLSPFDPEDGWSAVLGIRRGLKLVVTGHGKMLDPLIEAWAGQPGESTDGIAVVELAGGGLAIARVPMCSCGNRGCGNAGIQLRKEVAAGDLPALVALLRTLPWSGIVPTRSNVLCGDGLAALPAPGGSERSKIVYHGAKIRDGRLLPMWKMIKPS